jgi:hypothetical protein
MNYQPPKALQAQTKNSAIKPAIQNKFEFDSKIPFTCKHGVIITGIGVTRDDHLLLCVSDEMSVSKSSDFRGKSVSSVFIKRKIWFSDPFFVMKSNLCEIS